MPPTALALFIAAGALALVFAGSFVLFRTNGYARDWLGRRSGLPTAAPTGPNPERQAR